jgi:hypothetical protein
MRKSVGRLIPSSASSETEATILPGPHEPMAQWVKEELKDGDRICEAAGVRRTEGGRLPVAKIVNKLRSTDQSATPSINVGGRDFYELCQQYRWAKHDPLAEFAALQEYVKTGKLPWPSLDGGVERLMAGTKDG